jgi:hypothetical protein
MRCLCADFLSLLLLHGIRPIHIPQALKAASERLKREAFDKLNHSLSWMKDFYSSALELV